MSNFPNKYYYYQLKQNLHLKTSVNIFKFQNSIMQIKNNTHSIIVSQKY